MRPLALELEGFSAYRESAKVDFGDVDFFSLTGPTGSGKSSLIDAMIFALFGRVPRLGGNAVAPAIAAGADRARVRFDFEVGDEAHTVVRMAVRTSSGGASVREARLLRGDEAIASGADDVTTAVEELLRLRFEDFTRTVVLPQGEFARFLTATKAERQGLLRNLLGLDVYTVVRELARARQAVSTERAESARRSLDNLEVPNDDDIAAARQHRDVLEELAATMVEREKRLSGLDAAVSAARAEEERLAGSIERLEGLAPPDRLEGLASLITTAEEELTSAESVVEELETSLQTAAQRRKDLPSLDKLRGWARTREKKATLESRLAGSDLEPQRLALDEAEATATSAMAGLDRARTALAAARLTHAAHGLAGRLVAGEPCPVCAQVVVEVPETGGIAELEDLEEAESRAVSVARSTRETLDATRNALTKSETGHEELVAQLDDLDGELADVPTPDEIAALVNEVEKLVDAERRLDGELRSAAQVAKTARSRLEDLAEESRRVG
ncbi:MAG: AAA family ATPase, partial [Acidimicrobiia bacterium]